MNKYTLIGIGLSSTAIFAVWWNAGHNDSKLAQDELRTKQAERLMMRGTDSGRSVVERSKTSTDDCLPANDASQVSSGSEAGQEQSMGLMDPPKNGAGHETESADTDMDDMVGESPLEREAIRLSDDFALPAAVMHLAGIEAGHETDTEMSPQIKAAVSHLIDDFYRDVNEATRGDSGAASEEQAEPIDESGSSKSEESEEMVRVVEPSEMTQEASEKANRSHRLLFGDEAANRYGLQSMHEVRLPAKEEAREVDRNE